MHGYLAARTELELRFQSVGTGSAPAHAFLGRIIAIQSATQLLLLSSLEIPSSILSNELSSLGEYFQLSIKCPVLLSSHLSLN